MRKLMNWWKKIQFAFEILLIVGCIVMSVGIAMGLYYFQMSDRFDILSIIIVSAGLVIVIIAIAVEGRHQKPQYGYCNHFGSETSEMLAIWCLVPFGVTFIAMLCAYVLDPTLKTTEWIFETPVIMAIVLLITSMIVQAIWPSPPITNLRCGFRGD